MQWEIVAMFKNLLLTILFILPMAAHAHSPLASSSPENGETLDVSPTEIVMDFKSPTELVKVQLTRSNGKQGKSFLGGLFGSGDGESVMLSDSFRMSIEKRHVITLPSLKEGHYLLSWRALGEDGHVTKGDLTFNVKGS